MWCIERACTAPCVEPREGTMGGTGLGRRSSLCSPLSLGSRRVWMSILINQEHYARQGYPLRRVHATPITVDPAYVQGTGLRASSVGEQTWMR